MGNYNYIILGAILGLIVACVYPQDDPLINQVLSGDDSDALAMVLQFSNNNNTTEIVDGVVVIDEPNEEVAKSDNEKKPENAFKNYIIYPNSNLVLNVTPSSTGYAHTYVELTEKWNNYSRTEQKEIVSSLGDKIVDILVEGIDKKPYAIYYKVNGATVATYTSYYKPQGDKLVLSYTVSLN
ncbi:hypothetical protein [Methanococcus maripaludis]|uniref:Uncharacterized protein n=1 Tax=Methanococcus maripaludis TaxID=39152 RepID=A0A7J9PR75_METMI|nr:hypothetical protein [Methanococcus maripaludis]MBA2863989.1 hypothetical protein [Methanococcus maripaludis]